MNSGLKICSDCLEICWELSVGDNLSYKLDFSGSPERQHHILSSRGIYFEPDLASVDWSKCLLTNKRMSELGIYLQTNAWLAAFEKGRGQTLHVSSGSSRGGGSSVFSLVLVHVLVWLLVQGNSSETIAELSWSRKELGRNWNLASFWDNSVCGWLPQALRWWRTVGIYWSSYLRYNRTWNMYVLLKNVCLCTSLRNECLFALVPKGMLKQLPLFL